MSDQPGKPSKKDLTDLLELAKSEPVAASPNAIPALPEIEISKVESFESLEDYAKHHPIAEPPPEGAPSDDSQFPVSPDAGASPDPLGGHGLDLALEPPPAPGTKFIDLPGDEAPAETEAEAAPVGQSSSSDELPSLDLDPPGPESEPEPVTMAVTAPEPDPLAAPAAANGGTDEFEEELGGELPAPAIPAPPAPEARSTLEKVKAYSESLPVGQPPVAASFPFSLKITGRLTDAEREKLVDLLNRENYGIREVDLEPQFQAGRILIPRISEYAGVLILQALRAAQVNFDFGPSDSVFSSREDTEETGILLPPTAPGLAQVEAEPSSDAEDLPVSSSPELPGGAAFRVLDVVTASAFLNSTVVEAKSSIEYQERLENLQRELKYKAYRKGANAILNFAVQLTPLSLPTQYRLTVSGSAVKRLEPTAAEPSPELSGPEPAPEPDSPS